MYPAPATRSTIGLYEPAHLPRPTLLFDAGDVGGTLARLAEVGILPAGQVPSPLRRLPAAVHDGAGGNPDSAAAGVGRRLNAFSRPIRGHGQPAAATNRNLTRMSSRTCSAPSITLNGVRPRARLTHPQFPLAPSVGPADASKANGTSSRRLVPGHA